MSFAQASRIGSVMCGDPSKVAIGPSEVDRHVLICGFAPWIWLCFNVVCLFGCLFVLSVLWAIGAGERTHQVDVFWTQGLWEHGESVNLSASISWCWFIDWFHVVFVWFICFKWLSGWRSQITLTRYQSFALTTRFGTFLDGWTMVWGGLAWLAASRRSCRPPFAVRSGGFEFRLPYPGSTWIACKTLVWDWEHPTNYV